VVVVESAMATGQNVTTVVAITKETTDPRAPVLLLLKQVCIVPYMKACGFEISIYFSFLCS